MAYTYSGIGAVGDSGNLKAFIAADSPNITTPAQLTAANSLDPLSTAYDDVSFVTKLPLLSAATAEVLYIDASGNMVVKAALDSTSFTVVGGAIPVPDCRLSSLAVGVKLTPAFNPNVATYTATTEDDTNLITAAAKDSDCTIAIKNGSTDVTNGEAATWSTGANTVTVTSSIGVEKSTYTITVTKS